MLTNNKGGWKTKVYECSFCKKTHVKLWRPYHNFFPLICATCAEKRQSSLEYYECIWKKISEDYVLETFTGKKLPLPKWIVDETGKVPSYYGPGPEGEPTSMTNRLIIDLKDFSDDLSSETTLIPAVPDKNDSFWGYGSIPEARRKWWEELPTL